MTARVHVGVFAALTLFTCAPAASADPDPSQVTYYLGELDSMGVHRPNDQLAVEVGEAICQHLAEGSSVDAIVRQAINAKFSGRDAGALLAVSTSAFCPEQAPTVQRWINDHGS